MSNPDLIVFVYTGERKNAGTDNPVHIILRGKDGPSSKPIALNHTFTNNFERGQIDAFKISHENVQNLGRFVEVEFIELWKDKTFGIFSDDWYVDKIMVENKATHKTFVFPLFRWIRSDMRYHIRQFDTCLPQYEEHPDQRKKELEEKKRVYQYDQKIPGGPVQIKKLPEDETFSFDHMARWDISKKKVFYKSLGKMSVFKRGQFKSLEDLEAVYDEEVFHKPRGFDGWKDDIVFGQKRINSINPTLTCRFTSVPDKFPITDCMLSPLLEGLTIHQAMELKKLYCCDLAVLEGISTKPGATLCTPILLLFVDSKKHLRPVAIQLFQKPAPDNPIFTPLDDLMTWTIVKMWYENADSCHHQALTHLGLTHLLMEGVAIASNRNLSPSHPVFKLLAPHFLYIIAINARGLVALVSPGGWVDKTMVYGAKGMLELIVKGSNRWRMDVEGLVPEDLKARGIDDPEALPNFYYRDDGLLLFHAIKKYVTSYVHLYYDSNEMIEEDEEIQDWAQELVRERNKSDGGVGLMGVPGNGTVSSKEDLVSIITSIIFTCSCSHASANFGQYDQYAYTPNYPTFLKGKPPTSKGVKMRENDILDCLPSQAMTQDILTVTKILSDKGTNSLGDFEVEYVFHPDALKIVDVFRNDLACISKTIKARNEQAEFPYEDLLPDTIPNSISI